LIFVRITLSSFSAFSISALRPAMISSPFVKAVFSSANFFASIYLDADFNASSVWRRLI
jgi:hypothetical protein